MAHRIHAVEQRGEQRVERVGIDSVLGGADGECRCRYGGRNCLRLAFAKVALVRGERECACTLAAQQAGLCRVVLRPQVVEDRLNRLNVLVLVLVLLVEQPIWRPRDSSCACEQWCKLCMR
jgi:hypothetical protein